MDANSKLPYPDRARLAHALWHRLTREIGVFYNLRDDPDTTSRGSMAKALVLGVKDANDFRHLADYINQFCGVRHKQTGEPMSTSEAAMSFRWWQIDPKAAAVFNGHRVARRPDGLVGVDLGVDLAAVLNELQAEPE
jgi:hypothetical protein